MALVGSPWMLVSDADSVCAADVFSLIFAYSHENERKSSRKDTNGPCIPLSRIFSFILRGYARNISTKIQPRTVWQSDLFLKTIFS